MRPPVIQIIISPELRVMICCRKNSKRRRRRRGSFPNLMSLAHCRSLILTVGFLSMNDLDIAKRKTAETKMLVLAREHRVQHLVQVICSMYSFFYCFCTLYLSQCFQIFKCSNFLLFSFFSDMSKVQNQSKASPAASSPAAEPGPRQQQRKFQQKKKKGKGK